MVGRTPLIDKLRELARNLWWTWQPNVIALFRELDPALWRRFTTIPSSSSSDCRPSNWSRGPRRWPGLPIDYAFRRLTEYLKDTDSWGAVHASILRARPVAYFSAEFGLHESLPIYSGGLGVLAGDHLKSASDLGIPWSPSACCTPRATFARRSTPTAGSRNITSTPIPICCRSRAWPAPTGRRAWSRWRPPAGCCTRESGWWRPAARRSSSAGRQRAGEQRLGPVADGEALRR